MSAGLRRRRSTRSSGLACRYLDGRGALFERSHRGRLGPVDGHGDLLADDIFCLDDGPRVLDCIEFDDGCASATASPTSRSWPWTSNDLGRPDLAERVPRRYREHAATRWPAVARAPPHRLPGPGPRQGGRHPRRPGRRRRRGRRPTAAGLADAPPRAGPGPARPGRRAPRHREVDAAPPVCRPVPVRWSAFRRDPQGARRAPARSAHRRPSARASTTRRARRRDLRMMLDRAEVALATARPSCSTPLGLATPGAGRPGTSPRPEADLVELRCGVITGDSCRTPPSSCPARR